MQLLKKLNGHPIRLAPLPLLGCPRQHVLPPGAWALIRRQSGGRREIVGVTGHAYTEFNAVANAIDSFQQAVMVSRQRSVQLLVTWEGGAKARGK